MLIGIAVKGKAVAGVVYQPFYKQSPGVQEGRAVWAALGLGMFCLFLPEQCVTFYFQWMAHHVALLVITS